MQDLAAVVVDLSVFYELHNFLDYFTGIAPAKGCSQYTRSVVFATIPVSMYQLKCCDSASIIDHHFSQVLCMALMGTSLADCGICLESLS